MIRSTPKAVPYGSGCPRRFTSTTEVMSTIKHKKSLANRLISAFEACLQTSDAGVDQLKKWEALLTYARGKTNDRKRIHHLREVPHAHKNL